ncbi:MAG: mechanosensitive ion channel family protein [Armatimonadetes bacterium]|nr:mechanosensitive ion channel family protein [Armatimonadota bacterium]
MDAFHSGVMKLLPTLAIFAAVFVAVNVAITRAGAGWRAKRLSVEAESEAEQARHLVRLGRAAANCTLLFLLAVSILGHFGVDVTPILSHPTLLKLARILGAYVLFRFLLNNIAGRIVVPILTREFAGHDKGRSQRIRTLAGVVRSTGNYLLGFIMVVVVLKQIGVDTTPVLTSASVIGVAVGFGSQKLVRDVITGLFLLAEDQFAIGHYVTIGAVTGTVEEIGMRTTRVRDDVGKLYIISNGDISTVCNHSAGLMSIFLDVPVPAATDLQKARAAVDAVGQDIEDEFGEGVLQRPHVEGVTAMTAAQVTLRIRYRAVVTLQERIQMRLRERIREQFAQEGISLA